MLLSTSPNKREKNKAKTKKIGSEKKRETCALQGPSPKGKKRSGIMSQRWPENLEASCDISCATTRYIHISLSAMSVTDNGISSGWLHFSFLVFLLIFADRALVPY